MEQHRYRYLLLCRHARHSDGELVARKDDDEEWRFPTESVARVLVEELAFQGLHLTKVLYAPTCEARRTAALLLQGLGGRSVHAEASGAGAQSSTAQSAVSFLERLLSYQELTAKEPASAEKKPPQPSLPLGPVTFTPPSWFKPNPRSLKIEHQEVEWLLPNRIASPQESEVSLKKEIDALGDGRALLLVGHQPLLGWLATYFSRGRGWVERAVPIDSSEVICLRLKKTRWHGRWRGPLMWTLAPDDRNALKEVGDKVKGKMESAKLLSAVITLVLTALLGLLLDPAKWDALGRKDHPVQASLLGWSYNGQTATQIAFVMLLGALALYLLTMYSYDRLLMPTRFWAEGRSERLSLEGLGGRPPLKKMLQPWWWRARGTWLPRRPPSSSAWVVYRNMQRIWFCLFTPANILVALALMVLASALLRLHGWIWVWAAAFFVVVAAWWRWFRPVLGSED
jgi:phosphohistidine phosphatase SixA